MNNFYRLKHHLLFCWLILLLGLTACTEIGLLEPLPEVTPIATAVPWQLELVNTGELIVDPVSNVVPAVDPDLNSLLGLVSQQQLMGYIQSLESFGTRNTFSTTTNPSFGVGAARQWIYGEFLRVGNGRLQVDFQEFPVFYGGFGTQARNIVATLPGSSASNDIIVLMAHYDTRSFEVTDGESLAPGANDNAAGIALLLESARLLSSRQWNQTIVFLATGAEEQGALGAQMFVQEIFMSGANVIAAINYDGVGGEQGIPQNIRLFASDLYASDSGELGRYYEYIAGLYVPDFPIHLINALDREGRFGDQREFVNAAMPAIRLTQSIENPDLLNSRQDTWQRIDYNYLQKVVQMNIAVVGNLAGAPSRPELPLIRAMEQPGQFQINWGIDENAAGYAISFRPIGSETFPAFRFVRAIEAGNVALTGLDPQTTYAVSMAALDANGRVSKFSDEVIIEAVSSTANAEP